MTVHADPLAAAEHNAHVWLADIAEALGTDDRRRAQRILRAWLHLVRDRLPTSGAVHFGAQLPEVLRGVYFEDWVPGRPPERSTGAQFLDAFARDARLSPDEAAAALTTVTSVLRKRFSPGQMDHALVLLPRAIRTALSGRLVPAAHSGGHVCLEGGPGDLPEHILPIARPDQELKIPHLDGYEHFRPTARRADTAEGTLPVYEWFERTELVS